MPGLEELGWLQFERLCELVLEADAGVDPTRWEGSADRCREVVVEDEVHLNGRTLAPPVLIRCQWYRQDPVESPPSKFKSVVMFAIGGLTPCKPTDRICLLTEMFPYRHHVFVTEPDYGVGFAKAASLVETACAGFTPPPG